MANHPHPDDDKAQNPDGAKPKPPAVHAPGSSSPPTMPNMEIDEPIEEALEVEEVFEDGVPIVEAAPASGTAPFVLSDEDVVAEEVAEATPASEVDLSRLFDDKPASGVSVAASVHEDAIVEAVSLSDVVAEEVVAEEVPASEIVAAEEVVEAAPASEIAAADLIPHVPPVSEIIVAAEPIHIAPASEVIAAAEPVHSAPASEVVAAQEEVHSAPASELAASVAVGADELVEAMPESAVVEAEEVEEYAEAMPEVVEEPSKAMRRGEGVLEEAFAEAEPVSGVIFDEVTEMAEAMPESAVEVAESGSSAVLYDEAVEVASAVTPMSGVADSGPTAAFESPASAAKSADSDVLATEIDFAEATEASGVEVGSDADYAAAEAGPSVEFDELLDEVDDASPVKQKPVIQEESTELDTEALAEEAQVYEETVSAKKKSKPRGTGDDIDLDELFGVEEAAEAVDAEEPEEAAAVFDDEAVSEAEPAEAVDAEDTAEAEAAEAFDEEMEAAEALDDEIEKPTKKGAKARREDDEELVAVADEEDLNAKMKGKKGKKDREKATVAPAPAQRGALMRVLIGMVLAVVIVVGLAGAGLFLAPAQVHELADMVDPEKTLQAKADRQKVTILDKKLADVTTERDTANKDLADARKKLDDAKGDREKLDQAIADKATVDKELTEVTAKRDAAEKKLDAAAKVLVDAKQLDDKADFTDAVLAKIIKGLGDDRKALAEVNALLKDADIKGKNGNGVKEVLNIKKGLEDNIAAVEKVLADENTKGKGDKGVLEIVDARNKVAKDRDALLDTLTQAFKEFIDGKIVPADADPRKQLVEGAKVARQKAESPLSIPLAQLGMSLGGIGVGTSKVVEQTFSTAKLAAELGWFKAREKFIETPQQKMNTYLALLQDRNQKDAKRLADMSREADWIRTPESRSSKADQAKARYVQALALRNQERFAEAKAALIDTVKLSAGIDAGWTQDARQSQKELTDPNEYYLPRVRKLLAAGSAKAALNEADTALQAIPGNTRLHAERGLIRCELIRGKGPKIADAAQDAIKADAKAAEKDAKFAAESAYIVGLLDEEMARWPEAEKQYREAIKLHEDNKAPANEGGKYRVALARLLLRDRTEAAVVPAPDNNDKNDKKKDAKEGASADPVERTIVLHPWSLLAAAHGIAQAVEDPEDPADTARYKEAIEQAKKLIASDDKDLKGAGYLALGKALSKMGQRTEGLKNYAEGLRLIYPGLSTKDLKELIDQHPAFQQPDAADTPNPLLSERFFGEGIHLYWSKKYPEAEAQFRQAVRYFDKDARYHYFLGLAQLQQRTLVKRDAAVYSFETGAKLEAKAAQSNPDAVRDINASLERIQGELRQSLNGYRYKAISGDAEEKKK